MAKQLTFETDAREAVLRGVQKLAKAVISTLGPRGRNAVLDKGWGGPTITKDGVSVAEEIELDDAYENMGAKLVKRSGQQDQRRRRRRHDHRDAARPARSSRKA